MHESNFNYFRKLKNSLTNETHMKDKQKSQLDLEKVLKTLKSRRDAIHQLYGSKVYNPPANTDGMGQMERNLAAVEALGASEAQARKNEVDSKSGSLINVLGKLLSLYEHEQDGHKPSSDPEQSNPNEDKGESSNSNSAIGKKKF
jgi:hypothetical protein